MIKKIIYTFAILFFMGIGFMDPCHSAMEKSENMPDLFVRVPKMVVPIIQNREFKGQYAMIVVVQAKDEKSADILRRLTPIVLDTLFGELYSTLSIVWSPTLHLTGLEVKQRLLKRLAKKFGEDKVKEILIQSIQEN